MSGAQYMLIFYTEDANYIHVEPMQNRTASEYIRKPSWHSPLHGQRYLQCPGSLSSGHQTDTHSVCCPQ
jgi:hypothetical protein